MSYILDALRKAEQERHLRQPPNLLVSPPPIQPTRQRLWLWLGLGLGLGFNIALLAYFLIQPQPKSIERTASAAIPEPPVAEPASAPPPSAVSRKTPISPPPPAEPLHPSITANPERPRKPSSKSMSGPSVTIGPEPIPTLDALPASVRHNFPTLNLDIHVYSPDADKRFVVVNGRRHREGDLIDDGVVLETVTLDGAILRQGSRRFRLPVPR